MSKDDNVDVSMVLRVRGDRRKIWAAQATRVGISLSELMRRGAEAMLKARDLREGARLRALTEPEAELLEVMDPDALDELGEPLTRAPSRRVKNRTEDVG
jgi:hypothetical protein